MIKIERGSITYLVLQIVTISVCGMILYPLFDLIICKVFTHSEFVYSVQEHIIEPIVFGCIFGIVFWVLDRKRK